MVCRFGFALHFHQRRLKIVPESGGESAASRVTAEIDCPVQIRIDRRNHSKSMSFAKPVSIHSIASLNKSQLGEKTRLIGSKAPEMIILSLYRAKNGIAEPMIRVKNDQQLNKVIAPGKVQIL